MEQANAAHQAKRHYKTQPKGINGQRLLKDWRTSGLSISAFCAKRKISVATFHYWRKKMERLGQTSHQSLKQASRNRSSVMASANVNGETSPVSKKQTSSKSKSKPQPKTKSLSPTFLSLGTLQLPRESMFELELNGGRLLRVPMDFDASALKKMLAVMEGE